MKITAIRTFPVWVGIRNQLLVKIETDEGIFGWGESGLTGREKAVVGALEHFAEIIVGMDPFNIGGIWQKLYRSQYFEGGRVLAAAQSAIDIALYDIKGKALGVPVYELLGGKQRDHIPTFATTSGEPGEAMIEQARMLIDAGWNAMRIAPSGHELQVYEPREHIATTARWCVKAREALGDDVVLGVDYHHRLSVAEAASFCQKMPSGTLDFLEEPIRDETPEAYEALRRMTDVPFAIGEEFASKWQFLPYIERDIHQYNRIDVCNVGGLTESMKVAGWSEAHYVDMMPHNPLGPICTDGAFRGCGAQFLLARNPLVSRRNPSRFRQLRVLSGSAAPQGRRLSGFGRSRAWRRSQRRARSQAGIQVLAGANAQPTRWLGDQLVGPKARPISN
jgi:galactonate dehydratase